MTPQEANHRACEILAKCAKGSNAYAVFLIDGQVKETRDNSRLYTDWEMTGHPLLIGRYTKKCTPEAMAEDFMEVLK